MAMIEFDRNEKLIFLDIAVLSKIDFSPRGHRGHRGKFLFDPIGRRRLDQKATPFRKITCMQCAVASKRLRLFVWRSSPRQTKNPSFSLWPLCLGGETDFFSLR